MPSTVSLQVHAHKTEDEQSKLAIRESFYVGDYIGIADTEEQAIRMGQSIMDTPEKTYLHIRKCTSKFPIVSSTSV